MTEQQLRMIVVRFQMKQARRQFITLNIELRKTRRALRAFAAACMKDL